MKNEKKYKTPEERANAFEVFCNDHKCAKCAANGDLASLCTFKWLELEAQDGKPLPCPFCGSTCSVNEDFGFYVKCTSRDCEYRSGYSHTRDLAVKNHNRIARFDSSPSE